MNQLLSDCCGVPPKSNGDSDTSDIGICPECGDFCEYHYYEEEEKPRSIPGEITKEMMEGIALSRFIEDNDGLDPT